MVFFKVSSFLLLLPLAISTTPILDHERTREWSGWGGDVFNNRWANHAAVSSLNIRSLTEQCRITYQYGVSATPTISGNFVYYPTWSGLFVALNYVTCDVLWQINVTDIVMGYAPISEVQAVLTVHISRTSPQLDGDVLFFGTQTHALCIAVNRHSGKTLGLI
jgi:hypothetical protein